MRILFAVLVAVVLAQMAVLTQSGFIFVGIPGASCGDWLDGREKRELDSTLSQKYKDWQAGFVDGYLASGVLERSSNADGHDGFPQMSFESNNMIAARFESWCVTHRHDTLRQAGIKIVADVKRDIVR